ncbi:hypothetical protein M9458_007637, partial [Cirrhinus mrigala]
KAYSSFCSRPECADQERAEVSWTGHCDCSNQDGSSDGLPAAVDTRFKSKAVFYRRAGKLQFKIESWKRGFTLMLN